MTDEQIEECLLEAEREADAPESEWLLYGQKVAKKAQAEMQGRLAARDARIAELERTVAHQRGLLFWALYHAQGGSSEVGQVIRRWLGIGRHERLTDQQIAEARNAAGTPERATARRARQEQG